MKESRGLDIEKKHICGVISILVCSYLQETQWLTGKHICGSSVFGVYLSKGITVGN